MEFKLHSEYQPTGDQPQAIQKLVEGYKSGSKHETLLGVTGSGKTFTMANVIAAIQKPTLIISHNKTLAAQLYGEMKSFFPENAVEYFLSYYDYAPCFHRAAAGPVPHPLLLRERMLLLCLRYPVYME